MKFFWQNDNFASDCMASVMRVVIGFIVDKVGIAK